MSIKHKYSTRALNKELQPLVEINSSQLANVLVIGYGNLLRGDDAVGQHLAEEIERWHLPNVKILPLRQLTPDLAEDIAKVDYVIFADASAEPLESPRLVSIQPDDSGASSSHAAHPSYLLYLADLLYGYAPKASWLMLPATSFELSEELSPEAERGLKKGLELLRRML